MAKKDKVRYAKLIANPGAGKGSEMNKNLQAAVGCLERGGLKVDVALAKPKEEAALIAQKAVKQGYKTVIAMGGDGTVESAMRGLIGSKTHLGILPFGTENNVAKSLGIPEKLEDACALIASDQFRKLDVGQVKLKGQDKFYFFELTVLGLVAALYPDSNKILKGNLSRIKDAAEKLLREGGPAKFYLTLDDESKIEVETMLVVISNTPIFGKGFLVAPNASLDDGLLDVSVYPNFSKTELLAYYASVMNEGYSDNDKIQRYRVRKLDLKAGPKQDVVADGVVLGKGNVTIKVRPTAVRIIAPEPKQSPGAAKKSTEVEVPPPVYPARSPAKAPVPTKQERQS